MNLSESIMLRFAESERFGQWRVEAIQEPEFKLIWTLLEVLELAEGESQINHSFPRLGLEGRRQLAIGKASQDQVGASNFPNECRGLGISVVLANDRCP